MMKSTKSIGDIGEKASVALLRRKHYRIVAINLHMGRNELDIIAKNRDFIVFVEVKTRTVGADGQTAYGLSAGSAVDRDKQRRTIAAARAYLSDCNEKRQPRFDVVEVYLTAGDKPRIYDINHIEDAFGVKS